MCPEMCDVADDLHELVLLRELELQEDWGEELLH